MMKAAHIQEIRLVLHLRTGKLLLKGRFLFWVENWAEQLSTDFKPGISIRVSRLKSIEVGLSGSQEMHISLFDLYLHERK